jgi:hypothetical protein
MSCFKVASFNTIDWPLVNLWPVAVSSPGRTKFLKEALHMNFLYKISDAF